MFSTTTEQHFKQHRRGAIEMREDVEEVLSFGGAVIATTYLLGLLALLLWQSIDAVYVVVICMGGITVLVVASCEIQDMPLLEE